MVSWWEETLHDGVRLRLSVDELLYETNSDFQHLMLFENKTLGRVLTIDGIVQTTECDEFIYHEMLSHPPILGHGSARNVLIVGGGDGGMLSRVLMHPDIEEVVVVEIDKKVINVCRTYLPSICGGAFDDTRTKVVIGDGARYVSESRRQFDIIIVDSPDPVGPAKTLFEKKFYSDCKSCLKPSGILVTQNGVPFFQGIELTSTMQNLRTLFRDATCYLAPVPVYVGGFMAFGWASDDALIRKIGTDVLAARVNSAMLVTRYYTPEIHKAAFSLPPYVAAHTLQK